MEEALTQKIEEFKEYLKKIEYLQSISSLMHWDMRVNIPKKGVAHRGEVLGYISGEIYKLQTSDRIKEFIDYFNLIEDLDDVTKAMVEKTTKDYNQTKKIPEDRYKGYVIAVSNSEAAWEDAKDKSDFNLFQPHLERIVAFNKEFVDYWGYDKNKYDTLLDFYEPGITVDRLDKVFGELRDAIVTLLEKVQNSKVKTNPEVFTKNFPKKDQEEFGLLVLKQMGFDFEAGRLDESVHPFTINFNNKDVRITTKYHEDDFRSALFGTIHEGGHALYEQNIPDELSSTLLNTGVSMGIHESQSRYYENILGRSKEFWKYFYPEVQKRFKQFDGMSLEEFYREINDVRPSLIRIEADELTYSLHIIIRYEIEKALINGEVEVKDMPRVWNEKYKEYLGVEPGKDSEGVLQDVHWSGGMFGYFPSYALGNLYGAQFLSKMLRDLPNYYGDIEEGRLGDIKNWLKENIHRHGSIYKPAELLKMVTGEELTAKYFIDYLNKKYSEIYEF